MHHGRGYNSRQLGMTLLEILVVISISVIVLMALLRFLVAGYPLSKTTVLQQRSTEPQRVIYYANVDADPATERVRLELSGTSLVRGVTKPTGDPLVYDQNNDV